MNEEIIQAFFRVAEIGDWESTSIKKIAQKIKMKEVDLKKIVATKEEFLSHYNDYIDVKVLGSISNEDLEHSTSDEILQEYLMLKFEYMSENKMAIGNIINTSLANKKFIFMSLSSNKKSIRKFIEKASVDNSFLKKNILIKLLLALWFIAFNKWLYEDNNNEVTYSLIDKGIKTFKKNFKVF